MAILGDWLQLASLTSCVVTVAKLLTASGYGEACEGREKKIFPSSPRQRKVASHTLSDKKVGNHVTQVRDFDSGPHEYHHERCKYRVRQMCGRDPPASKSSSTKFLGQSSNACSKVKEMVFVRCTVYWYPRSKEHRANQFTKGDKRTP